MNAGSFDAVVSNGMATIARSSDAAGKSVEKVGAAIVNLEKESQKRFRDMGQAVAKMGGPLGSIGSRIFGGAGMSSGMRTLALGMTAAGIAMKVFSDAIATAEIKARALAAAMASVRQVSRQAAEARSSFALGAEGTGRLAAKAEALFGPDASSRAASVAKNYGGSQEDAMRAMVASRRIDPRFRGQAIEIAAQVGANSEASADEIMTLLSDPASLARVLNAPGGQDGKAAMALMLSRGQSGDAAFRSAMQGVTPGAGGARARTRGVDQASDIVTRAQVDAFKDRSTEAAKRLAAADAVNPEAAALREWGRNLQESQQKLADLAEATPKVIRLLQRYTPQGDAEIQAMREANAAGAAIVGTQTP